MWLAGERELWDCFENGGCFFINRNTLIISTNYLTVFFFGKNRVSIEWEEVNALDAH